MRKEDKIKQLDYDLKEIRGLLAEKQDENIVLFKRDTEERNVGKTIVKYDESKINELVFKIQALSDEIMKKDMKITESKALIEDLKSKLQQSEVRYERLSFRLEEQKKKSRPRRK